MHNKPHLLLICPTVNSKVLPDSSLYLSNTPASCCLCNASDHFQLPPLLMCIDAVLVVLLVETVKAKHIHPVFLPQLKPFNSTCSNSRFHARERERETFAFTITQTGSKMKSFFLTASFYAKVYIEITHFKSTRY